MEQYPLHWPQFFGYFVDAYILLSLPFILGFDVGESPLFGASSYNCSLAQASACAVHLRKAFRIMHPNLSTLGYQ
jgi:hypothetical protein